MEFILIYVVTSLIMSVVITTIESYKIYGCYNAPNSIELLVAFICWPLEIPFILLELTLKSIEHKFIHKKK